MTRHVLRSAIKYLLLLLTTVLITVLALRLYQAEQGPPLAPWHTQAPDEWQASQIDGADWAGWLLQEQRVMLQVKQQVSDRLPAAMHTPLNRYWPGSRVYPGHFTQDWNRSYQLMPTGAVRGVAVMLHGLTDSPYSLRHIALEYQRHGFVVIGLRLPGHGTVPAGLIRVTWQDWQAATRLAVRAAARYRQPGNLPLHLVGFSNGGALAVKYALDAINDRSLSAPDRLVLISPMIGLTRYARFAGVAGWPALLPSFAGAAWLDRLPEYNPFKYNSFTVNAARQSWLLTRALQQQLLRQAQDGSLARLAPVLTFQSVMDSTVSAPAVLKEFYQRLPANGSEIVLYDVNHSAYFSSLLTPAASSALSRLLPAVPRRYTTRIISNDAAHPERALARITRAGASSSSEQPLAMAFPADVYSLSHVALPFPPDDSLYGRNPAQPEEFGLPLGTLVARGEKDALVVNQESLMRINSNPFFADLIECIDAILPAAPQQTHH